MDRGDGSAQQAPHVLPAEEGSYDVASADIDAQDNSLQGTQIEQCFLQKPKPLFLAVLRIRIRLFLGLLDPDLDLLVTGMDLDSALDPDWDPSVSKQK